MQSCFLSYRLPHAMLCSPCPPTDLIHVPTFFTQWTVCWNSCFGHTHMLCHVSTCTHCVQLDWGCQHCGQGPCQWLTSVTAVHLASIVVAVRYFWCGCRVTATPSLVCVCAQSEGLTRHPEGSQAVPGGRDSRMSGGGWQGDLFSPGTLSRLGTPCLLRRLISLDWPLHTSAASGIHYFCVDCTCGVLLVNLHIASTHPCTAFAPG